MCIGCWLSWMIANSLDVRSYIINKTEVRYKNHALSDGDLWKQFMPHVGMENLYPLPLQRVGCLEEWPLHMTVHLLHIYDYEY